MSNVISGFEGTVGFDGYRIACIIGVHGYERELLQEVTVDLRVPCLFGASSSDSIFDTIDYTSLAKTCREVAEKGQFHLVETLAWEMIEAIFQGYPVSWVWVKIRKLEVMQDIQAAVVELKRYREEK